MHGPEEAGQPDALDGRAKDAPAVADSGKTAEATAPADTSLASEPAPTTRPAAPAGEPQYQFAKGVISGLRDRVTTLAFKLKRDRLIGLGLAAGDQGGDVQFFGILPTVMAAGARFRHPQGVNQLEFSPDGARLASTGGNHSIVIWDVWARR